MSFKLGKKLLILNDPAQAQLLFYSEFASGVRRLVETDDDYQTTTPFDDLAANPDIQSGAEGAGYLPATVANDETIAQAQMLRILGLVDLEGVDIVSVVGSKGAIAVKQIATVTLTVPAPVAGQEVTVSLNFQSENNEGEFATNLSDYKRKKLFTLVVATGETATTLALKLTNAINAISDSGWQAWVTATVAAGVITLTSFKGSVTFTATFSGSAIDAGGVTGAFATTTAGYGGRNTYDQLKALRLDTVSGWYAENKLTDQIPLKTAVYSSYLIKKRVSRPDLQGFGHINDTPTGDFEILIFVNEAQTAYISNLTKWLNANAANRTMYASTTAAAILAGDPATAAVVVDSSEPFTTPLV